MKTYGSEKLMAMTGCGFIILWASTLIFYWALSGFTLKYTLDFWLSYNRGEQVDVAALPSYAVGGFLGGIPIATGTITWIVDVSDVLE